MRTHRSRQAGDTLVEVLIAISIITTILAGAYVTSNTSLLATRDAQEHTNALKLASAQLELLAAQPPATAFLSAIPPGGFCYALTAGAYIPQYVVGANCTVTSQGTLASPGVQPAYATSVTYDTSSLIFTVTITWDSVTGHGNGQIQMYYRTDK